MDLCSKKAVKFWLKKYGLQPSKRLGQNFLIDKSVLRKIVRIADLKPGDVVLEIGPGIGTLTQELARSLSVARAARRDSRGGLASPAEAGGWVIAVEKDGTMVKILKETLKNFQNVKVIQADVLKLNPQTLSHKAYDRTLYETLETDPKNYKLPSLDSPSRRDGQTKNYKLISNLPYNIASAVIRKFLEAENPPSEMILMVQKEVAQRICAKPGKMSLLAVSVQFYSDVKIISYVSKKSFYPSPKVDSAIIKIVPRQFRVPFPRQFREQFFRIAKAGFSQPRKQLVNNLSKNLKKEKQDIKSWLLKNNIQPSQRAETLSVNDWINLTKSL